MWNWVLKELMVGCGLALLLGAGVWQHRGPSLPAAKTVDLASIPHSLGDWSSTDFQLRAGDLAAAGIDSYLGRDYVHAETGAAMRVLIVSGPGGPISVHPPEVCFAGQGYVQESVIETVKAPAEASGQEHRFSTAIFRGPESSGGLRVQLLWSWADSGIWRTPSNPRLAFARLPRLYKIYVSRALGPKQGREDVADCLEFMSLLLPEFETRMSADQPPPAASTPAGDVTETSTAEPPLPAFVPSRFVRRNARQISRPMLAQFPVEDGEFRL